MIDKETIHAEWGSVIYPPNSDKAHLFDDCKYIKNSDTKSKDIDKYPVGHLDFCSECKKHFQEWRNGMESGVAECERCGKKEIKGTFCMDCALEIDRKQAQSKL